VRPADLQAVRAACAANRVEARKVNAKLARGRRAVKEMTAEPGARPTRSLTQLIERIVGIEAAVGDLIVLACGHGDRPLDSLRAYDVLEPVFLRTFRPPGASTPPLVLAAVERIALGRDPADFTA